MKDNKFMHVNIEYVLMGNNGLCDTGPLSIQINLGDKDDLWYTTSREKLVDLSVHVFFFVRCFLVIHLRLLHIQMSQVEKTLIQLDATRFPPCSCPC